MPSTGEVQTDTIEKTSGDMLGSEENVSHHRSPPIHVKPGRRSVRGDMRSKLEGSRKSAQECRTRRKLRYQYLEELVASRERSIQALYQELEIYKKACNDLDEGRVPKQISELLAQDEDIG